MFGSQEALDAMRPFCVADPSDLNFCTLAPATAAVTLSERHGQIVTFAAFVVAGLIPPFSEFFMDVLMKYGVRMAQLSPNALLTLATFSHLCEAFVGVMPSVCVFRRLFKMSKTGGDD